ncbi:MAG: S1 family peptidase, partial [Cytophagaceae bacterium]|nr:S1 family peptidase [Cytophagaceae bacterium]
MKTLPLLIGPGEWVPPLEPWRIQPQPFLRPGLGIGGVFTGTAGMLLRDGAFRPYLLTCQHVLHYPRAGLLVSQPALGFDGGRAGLDTVGASFWGLFPESGLDAALARLDPRFRPLDPTVAGTTDRIRNIGEARVGQRLIKSGRTTSLTSGLVEAFGNYPVPYPQGMCSIRGFLIRTENPGDARPIAVPGDSGDIWYDPQTGAAVGLLVAGGQEPQPYAIACS